MPCRLHPESQILTNLHIHRVFVRRQSFVHAALWLDQHGEGHYCVSATYPEDGRSSELLHLLTDQNTAFELKMRFA
ncbi:MAG: hypothetical protein EOO77_21105 [Oxalobacteraceae bacterium]|nr:MAG: hypothetical protein EOO77_21105 [Oxalobacteraceae bacterium]